MAYVEAGVGSAPEIELRQLSSEWNGVTERWSIAWRTKNKAAHSLRIDSVRLPHSQFKAEEQRFEPALMLSPSADVRFQSAVRCDEPVGRVTENAFLIFQVMWLGEPWRIFVRVRVAVGSNREPHAEIELITTQRAGFSGVSF